jgi:SanA protein
MGKKKIFLYSSFFVIIITFFIIFFCNKIITDTAAGKLYVDADIIPFNKVGLLLGTSKYIANGNVNPFFYNRIQAAVRLIKAGKIKYIIVSGDNSRANYNEPEAMREDLIQAGIDSLVIFLDYAGFRTFDSIVRLREIFNQNSVTIISQQFHNERAIYIASKEGINAVAFNAKDVSEREGLHIQLREKFARVKVFIDYLFNKKPKYLGAKVIIP